MAEKRENNEEFENSQSSQLEEEHRQKLEADSVPENTKKQTSWLLKKFTQWLEKRKINCDLLTVSPAELNGILRRFYAKVKIHGTFLSSFTNFDNSNGKIVKFLASFA